MIRTAPWLIVTLLAWFHLVPGSAVAQMSDAEILADRLLWAAGGRPAWNRLANTIVYSQQYRRDDPTALGAVITIDYSEPRVRIDTTGRDLQQIRLIDGEGDRSWRLDRQGRPETVAEDRLARDLHRYAGHVFRTLQRVAAGDPALRLAVGRTGSLEVFEGNRRIAWYLLDARGEPYAMGAHDDDGGVICGPWDVEERGIRHPAWISRPDGSWRASVKSLAVNVRMDEELFKSPLATRQ